MKFFTKKSFRIFFTKKIYFFLSFLLLFLLKFHVILLLQKNLKKLFLFKKIPQNILVQFS